MEYMSSLSMGCVEGDASMSRPLATEGDAVDWTGNAGMGGSLADGGCAEGRLADDGRSPGPKSPLLEGAEALRKRVGKFCKPRKSPL